MSGSSQGNLPLRFPLRFLNTLNRLSSTSDLQPPPSLMASEQAASLTDGDAVASTMVQSEVEELLSDGNFPEGHVYRIPEDDERADAQDADWLTFFEYPFKIGHKFPFSGLVQDALSFWSLSPSQIMPSGWRLLRSLDRIIDRFPEIGFSFEVFEYNYYPFRSRSNLYSFRVRTGRKPLVSRLDVNDRGWKHRFFFVDVESLGFGTECSFLKTEWSSESKCNIASIFLSSSLLMCLLFFLCSVSQSCQGERPVSGGHHRGNRVRS